MNSTNQWNIAKKRLTNLPRGAVVQFAVQCARRALPLYPGRPDGQKIVRKAIRLADTAAATATIAPHDEEIFTLQKFYVEEGQAARNGEISTSYYAAAAAYAAYLAATGKDARAAILISSQEAAEMAIRAYAAYHGANDPRVLEVEGAIIEDLADLERLSVLHAWTDQTPVSSAFLRQIDRPKSIVTGTDLLGSAAFIEISDDRARGKITISVSADTESARHEVFSRTSRKVRRTIRSLLRKRSPIGPENPGKDSPYGFEDALLSEKSYRLLSALAEMHCKINKTTWCVGVIDRSNAQRFISELERQALIERDARGLFSISSKGREYLAEHPRKR